MFMIELTLIKKCVSIHGKGQRDGKTKERNRSEVHPAEYKHGPEQLKRVIAFCQKEDRAISWVIRQALDKYLDDNVA